MTQIMKHTRIFFLAVSTMSVLAACGTQATSTFMPVPTESNGEEPQEEPHVEIPEEYAGLTNPYAGESQAISLGEDIYQVNCASCHGPEGEGDGPAASALDPKPANLADATMMQAMSDGYLFWRVTEGGGMEPFNSQMPAWGDVLTEKDHWQVISYLRTLAER